MIGVTSFFRDPEAYQFLAREVIPTLFAERDPDDPERIWHAGCATGEEVYSMAILLQEYLNERRLTTRVQIFANDIDEAAIGVARAGLYPDGIGADVEEERLKHFFTWSDCFWQVTKQIREMIVFAPSVPSLPVPERITAMAPFPASAASGGKRDRWDDATDAAEGVHRV